MIDSFEIKWFVLKIKLVDLTNFQISIEISYRLISFVISISQIFVIVILPITFEIFARWNQLDLLNHELRDYLFTLFLTIVMFPVTFIY